MQQFNPLRIEVIYDFAVTGVHGLNLLHILFRQSEIKYIQVLFHSVLVDGFGDYDHTALDIPAKCHLCCGFPVLPNPCENRVAKEISFSLIKGCPCFRNDSIFFHSVQV